MPDTHPRLADALTRDDDRLREDAAAFALDGWSLIELSGEDRLDWLQGQATNDVRVLTEGRRVAFCLCEPTGQLLAVVDAWALEDRIFMAVPRERTTTVLARIERMTIMEDVAARVLSEGYSGVSFQGPKASEILSRSFALPVRDAGAIVDRAHEPAALCLRSDRTGMGGWDVWFPERSRIVEFGIEEAMPGAVEAARIEAGIPKWEVDMGLKTLPPELGPAFEARHVSYNKGCYTGQEVLMRMHSRGHTNKTWVGLVSPEPFHVGNEVSHGGKVVGTVSSAAYSPKGRHVGAATLRNEAFEEGTIVTVGGVEAEVRSMPILRSL